MTSRSVRRYVIAIGERATVRLANPADPLLRVAARDEGVIEFWAEHIDDGDVDGDGFDRVFEVFGTGHPLPPNAQWRGTASRTELGLVWHLYELQGDR